jgi:N-ethylmaleimide reductase
VRSRSPPPRRSKRCCSTSVERAAPISTDPWNHDDRRPISAALLRHLPNRLPTMTKPDLFAPFRLGPLLLPNRFVMAPMTRGRATADGVPTPRMARYYGSRAAAGLLVTEATAISPGGRGWLNAPGIHSEAQVAAWRPVTAAVHGNGGRIFLQLWHMGRVSHPEFLGGALPVGPSAIAAKGEAHTPSGKHPYVTPRELTTTEIAAIANDYAAAARRARAAGFDGVEIHGANGYLIDQFLRDGSNQRSDRYGGSIANRTRFLLEVTDAVAAAWAPDRVGVRVSPTGNYNDMQDRDPAALYGHVARELNRRGLAYLHVMEPRAGSPMHVPLPPVAPTIRAAYRGALIVNGGYDAAAAQAAIAAGATDLVAFGVPFLANPDFVRRVRKGAPLNPPDFATLYTSGDQGYIDYPALD